MASSSLESMFALTRSLAVTWAVLGCAVVVVAQDGPPTPARPRAVRAVLEVPWRQR